jgi:dTDP-3,4-didehydro-2,6-dideoxy-alpha-D-glucose 3-reductase
VTPPVRIGVMGCADIARRRVIPVIKSAPDAELAAVASRDPHRAADLARQYGCRPVHGYAELLALAEIDAVYIPLPAALLARWTQAALQAGKHVLAEKPLATDPASAKELLAMAQASRLALMENVMFPHHRQHTTMRQLAADGVIGELRSFHAAFAVPARPARDIRLDPGLGGGSLWDTGVYPVRAALFYLGSSLSVAGAILSDGNEHRVDTSGHALLRSSAGVGAQLTFGLDHAYYSSCTLWGSQGRLTLDHAFMPPADHVPTLRLERRSGTEEIPLPPDDQVANTLGAFTAAVRSGTSPDRQAIIRQAELLAGIASLGGAAGCGLSAR